MIQPGPPVLLFLVALKTDVFINLEKIGLHHN